MMSSPVRAISLAAIMLGLSFGLSRPAQALPSGFHESLTAVTGLSQPTAMAFAPDGRLFIAEKCGAIRLVKAGKLQATSFARVKTTCTGERGVIGLTLDPNFLRNGYVYVHFTVPASPPFNRVARLTADPANRDIAQTGSFRPLMDMNRLSSATNHNGGAIHFRHDGKLYIGVGDNANSANAQNLNNRLGKILRINPDGTIPTDNPLYNRTTGYNRAIWAHGLRNPYTFAADPAGRRVRINDVGANSWEEVNAGVAGANYGWPTCEGACSRSGLTNPIYQYAHNGSGAAITGGTFYRGRHFPASYDGNYFFGDYIRNFIRRIDNNGQVTTFLPSAKSPVDLAVGPNGVLYYLSIGQGKLYRIRYGS